jgi:hypothetical protein
MSNDNIVIDDNTLNTYLNAYSKFVTILKPAIKNNSPVGAKRYKRLRQIFSVYDDVRTAPTTLIDIADGKPAARVVLYSKLQCHCNFVI